MQVLRLDPRGVTRIRIENPDDLWELANIIAPGDVIGSRTLRTIDKTKGTEKRSVYLKVRAEKVSLEETGVLRVLGEIVEGPEDVTRGYHSLVLKEGSVIDIEKEWSGFEIERLKRAAKRKSIMVLACVVDDHGCDFGVIRDSRIEMLGSVSAPGGRKVLGESSSPFYTEVAKRIMEYGERFETIIIGGPGFAREYVKKKLEELGFEKRVFVEPTSVRGRTGVVELVRRGAVDRVARDSRISRETRLVEEFEKHLGTDTGLAVYGIREVEEAVNMGATKDILVSEPLLSRPEVRRLLSLAEKSGATVHVVSTSHDAGERLSRLSGIAAILRYKIR